MSPPGANDDTVPPRESDGATGTTHHGDPSTASPAVERWLLRRLEEIPSDLALAVRRLAGREPGLTPERMAHASLEGFERVAARVDDRDRALDLLAADALLTYAFEAAADPDIGGSAAGADALADRFGPAGELGRRAAGRSAS